MGNPSVRFDEGRERVGHWPVRLSIQPFPPTLLKTGFRQGVIGPEGGPNRQFLPLLVPGWTLNPCPP